MGLFEHFPYTNFHELNLDWLLRMMKELSRRMDAIDGGDIATTIANIIQAMIRDGSMAALLEQIALNGRLVTSNKFESVPAQPSHYTVRPNLAELSSDELYGLYDAMTSDAFKRHLWGTDEAGKDLVYYTYDCESSRRTALVGEDEEPAGELAYQRDLAYTSNQLIITSGIHGDEKQNMWTLYHIVRAILDGDGPVFEYIRNNVNMVILPIVNPWGMDQVPAERTNSRGVDLNRNFPYAWDTWSSQTVNKGESAGSELSTQFVMDVVGDLASDKAFNGTVIIDFHDFFGSGEAYAPLYFLGSTTDPAQRIALLKAGMTALDYLDNVYPSLVENFERPVRVTNIGTSTPTFTNWALHLGFRHAQLHECRTYAVSQDDADRYDAVTSNLAWLTMTLSICSVAPLFIGGEKLYHIDSMTQLGLTPGYTLEQLIEAMPPRTTLSVPVYSTGSLFPYMPGDANGILYVDSANWNDIRAVRLMYQTFSVNNSALYVATAWAQAGSPLTISNWQELQPVT